MNLLNLHNKKILITGASAGIGRETAILADKTGATLFLTARNENRLKETQKLLSGKNHTIFAADLNEENAINSLTEFLPSLDGMVHCAGIIKPMPVKFIQGKHFDEVMSVNFKSAALITSKMAKQKKIAPNASLVFISSVSSAHPYLGGSLYVSSKAALEAFCRTVALELAPQKIRANCISPGLVKTAIYYETEAAASKEEMEKYEKKYPLGFGEPADISNMSVFLLSDLSRWITGQNIIMDGGLLLGSK